MAQNFRQQGHVVTLPVPAGAQNGDIVVVDDLPGVVVSKEATTDTTAAVAIMGVFELPKATGAIGAGQLVYADAGDNQVSATNATDRAPMGYCIKAASSQAQTVEVVLSPGSVTRTSAAN